MLHGCGVVLSPNVSTIISWRTIGRWDCVRGMAGTRWKSLFPPRGLSAPNFTLSDVIAATAVRHGRCVPGACRFPCGGATICFRLSAGASPESVSSGWRTNLVALRPLISPHLGSQSDPQPRRRPDLGLYLTGSRFTCSDARLFLSRIRLWPSPRCAVLDQKRRRACRIACSHSSFVFPASESISGRQAAGTYIEPCASATTPTPSPTPSHAHTDF